MSWRPLERINPATRLLMAIVLSVPVIVTLDWVSALTALVLELVVLALCGVVRPKLLVRMLPLVLVGLLGATSMVLYGEVGGRVHWHWGVATISDKSIALAVALFIRIFALALPSMALFLDIDATRMADGLAQVAKLPSRFVLGTLAGFRMLGLFTNDWRTLGHARRARGLGDMGRLRRWLLMSYSLLVLALRRGAKLATAMEARGFDGPTKRTWARPSTVGWPDAVGVLVSALIGVAAVAMAVHFGTFWAVWS